MSDSNFTNVGSDSASMGGAEYFVIGTVLLTIILILAKFFIEWCYDRDSSSSGIRGKDRSYLFNLMNSKRASETFKINKFDRFCGIELEVLNENTSKPKPIKLSKSEKRIYDIIFWSVFFWLWPLAKFLDWNKKRKAKHDEKVMAANINELKGGLK